MRTPSASPTRTPIFSDANNFFLEIQDHHLEQDKRLTPQLNRLSHETGLPLVATNDSHYLRREDARAHEILLCIQTGKSLSDPNRMRWSTPDFYLKSRAEMMELFGELEDALDRTGEIAQRCQVKLEKVKEPFPKFDVPAGHSADTYFEYVARQGFEKRRPRLEAMRAQGHPQARPGRIRRAPGSRNPHDPEDEILRLLPDRLGLHPLRQGARHPGRAGPRLGRGQPGRLRLDITDIDPLQYGLLFERFLNPERVSMPDIDVDFCMNRRGDVIEYVTEKYGRDQVAQIITFNTLGARAAISDVGRVLDMPFADVERVTKMVPNVLNISLTRPSSRSRASRTRARKTRAWTMR